MTEPRTLISGATLVILGLLAGGMLLTPIPASNIQPFTFILGALAGAFTAAGGARITTALSAAPVSTAQTGAEDQPPPS